MESKDISRGTGRVPFAPPCQPKGKEPQQEGWVLPGGIRTTVPEVAIVVASNIDRLYHYIRPTAQERPAQRA